MCDFQRMPIYIASVRGSRVPGKNLCDECKKYSSLYIWRYVDRSGNGVYICQRCKDEVYLRSHGGGDAMRLAVSGGGWGSNRNRH